jgi:hypothetical protein
MLQWIGGELPPRAAPQDGDGGVVGHIGDASVTLGSDPNDRPGDHDEVPATP